jgi:hypothetical protein
MELQDKITVITGGASGLGRATADYFVARGARVAIFDLNEEQGARAVAELGEDKALFATTDVTDEEVRRDPYQYQLCRGAGSLQSSGPGGQGNCPEEIRFRRQREPAWTVQRDEQVRGENGAQ